MGGGVSVVSIEVQAENDENGTMRQSTRAHIFDLGDPTQASGTIRGYGITMNSGQRRPSQLSLQERAITDMTSVLSNDLSAGTQIIPSSDGTGSPVVRTTLLCFTPPTARTSPEERILELADALYSVLNQVDDHIEQKPKFKSAPAEFVQSLPTRTMPEIPSHLSDNDRKACYICLGNYEEGDQLRVLPCKHEYHCYCVDKWLTEVHRVCPVCRQDICQEDNEKPPTAVENSVQVIA